MLFPGSNVFIFFVMLLEKFSGSRKAYFMKSWCRWRAVSMKIIFICGNCILILLKFERSPYYCAFTLKITPKWSEGRFVGVFLSLSGANCVRCDSPFSVCKLTTGETLDEIQTTLNWAISKCCGFVLCRKIKILNEGCGNKATNV